MAAKDANIKVGLETRVTADVGIGLRETGGFQLTVTLNVHVGGVDMTQAQALAKTAHEKICPYSHATRGNVDVEINTV